MANLSVQLCNMLLKNPIMPAAGPTTRNAEAIELCAKGGAGCLVTKTISEVAAEVPRPCMQEIPGGFLNTELWSEMPKEQWFSYEYKKVKELNLPVIVSLGYTSSQLSKVVLDAAPFADAFEISTHYVGKDIGPVVAALHEAKKGGVPVFMKISPGIPDVASFVKELEKEGADGFVAINSVGPCMRINVETGLPFMGSEKGYGWLSGRAVLPIALRHVYEIASAVSVPVIGVGGVSSGSDAMEMIMAGASAVQICTEAILKGPDIYGKVAQELNLLMDKYGYKDIESMRGITKKKMQGRGFKTEPTYPKVLEDKCISCKRCELSCAYSAIKVSKVAKIDESKCFGCGLCVTRCPKEAIVIE